MIFNFSIVDQPGCRIVDWPKTGWWHETLTGIELEIIDSHLEIDLKSYEAKVFVFRK